MQSVVYNFVALLSKASRLFLMILPVQVTSASCRARPFRQFRQKKFCYKILMKVMKF